MKREVSFNAGIVAGEARRLNGRWVGSGAARRLSDWFADEVMGHHGGVGGGYGPMSAVMAALMKRGADNQGVVLTEGDLREMLDALPKKLGAAFASAVAKYGKWFEVDEPQRVNLVAPTVTIRVYFRGKPDGEIREIPARFFRWHPANKGRKTYRPGDVALSGSLERARDQYVDKVAPGNVGWEEVYSSTRYTRANPSHSGCPGVGPGHSHYQGRCPTDWNVKNGEWRRVWPEKGVYAIIWKATLEPPMRSRTGWAWTLRQQAGGGEIAAGHNETLGAAKAQVSGVVGSMHGQRKNPTTTFPPCPRCGRLMAKRHMMKGGPVFVCMGPRGCGLTWAPGKKNPSVFNNGPWIAPNGNEIRGGDLIEYYVHNGSNARGVIWKRKRGKVNRLLVFDTHVVAGTGMGDVVNEENYIRLVRRASR